MENLGELSIHSISLVLNEYKMSSLKYKIKKKNIKHILQSIHAILVKVPSKRETDRETSIHTCTVVKLQV